MLWADPETNILTTNATQLQPTEDSLIGRNVLLLDGLGEIWEQCNPLQASCLQLICILASEQNVM